MGRRKFMSKMLRQVETGRLFPFTETLAERSDMELIEMLDEPKPKKPERVIIERHPLYKKNSKGKLCRVSPEEEIVIKAKLKKIAAYKQSCRDKEKLNVLHSTGNS